MIEIYSKQNIFDRLQKTKRNFYSLYNEKYTLSNLIYAFNQLTMDEQDLYLTFKRDKNNSGNYQRDREEIKRIIGKMRTEMKTAGDKLSAYCDLDIKNPSADPNSKKKVIFRETKQVESKPVERPKQVKPTKPLSDVQRAMLLIRNHLVEIKEVLDDDFGYDEKEIINLKYSEEPPLNNSAVALRKCIDTDEVNETTTKFYKKTLQIHHDKVLAREKANE